MYNERPTMKKKIVKCSELLDYNWNSAAETINSITENNLIEINHILCRMWKKRVLASVSTYFLFYIECMPSLLPSSFFT